MANSCNGCGLCCKLFLINLSRKEYQSGKYQTMFATNGAMDNFKQARRCGANLLAQRPDGGCIYLKDNKCGIHANRPKACRDFFAPLRLKNMPG